MAANFLEELYQDKPTDPAEKHLCTGAEHVLMEHMARVYEKQDAGTNPRRPRISARDLLSDAERVLTRTSGGLSLYERLQRDPQLRDDIMGLLKDFTDEAEALD